jgi:hypothetical protein
MARRLRKEEIVTIGVLAEGLAWFDALGAAAALFDGAVDPDGLPLCDLSDGSVAGDWRMPNLRELLSLAHFGVVLPVVPDTSGTGQWAEGDPFSGLLFGDPTETKYWSSTLTLHTAQIEHAWAVDWRRGEVSLIPIGGLCNCVLWPVRGGQ